MTHLGDESGCRAMGDVNIAEPINKIFAVSMWRKLVSLEITVKIRCHLFYILRWFLIYNSGQKFTWTHWGYGYHISSVPGWIGCRTSDYVVVKKDEFISQISNTRR